MIVCFDLFFFVLLICQFGLGFEEATSVDDNPNFALVVASGFLHLNMFNILTDGVCIVLSGFKLMFGIMYMMNVCMPKKISYEYLDDGLGKF